MRIWEEINQVIRSKPPIVMKTIGVLENGPAIIYWRRMRSLLLLSNLERGEVGFRFYTVCGQRCQRHIVINQRRVNGFHKRRTCGRLTQILGLTTIQMQSALSSPLKSNQNKTRRGECWLWVHRLHARRIDDLAHLVVTKEHDLKEYHHIFNLFLQWNHYRNTFS